MHELESYARKYNSPEYFKTDPIIFPKHFAQLMERGEACLQDVEIAAVIAAHLAWGRRDMIVRDCNRAFDEMGWKPYDYVRRGCYRDHDASLHRTVKWSEFAGICRNLKRFYLENETLEDLSQDEMRTRIYGQKSDPKAANKKINMLRRWMVRSDGIVDLGLWKHISPEELIIPLDVHVHRVALETGLTKRRQADLKTALEITEGLKKIFPGDPCLGDFALFAYGAERAAGKKN
ncbi:MAG: TIGR02757 family protein [Bacteroidales bacterium]|nr:TIGR02757 family protein [Bacteroidales bacterium]